MKGPRLSSSLPLPIVALAMAGLAASPPAPAQDRPLDSFEGTTDVLEVEIPVNVIDKHGESIRGLTAGEFEVFDEGEPQEIVDFQVVDLEVYSPDLRQVSPAMAAEAIPASARRHILLLFDLSFSDPTSVLRAREAAREFVLESLHPTDLVAVATHTIEGGANLVITFTPDRLQIARAVDTLGAPRLFRGARRDPLKFVLEGLSPSGEALASLDTSNGRQSSAVTGLQQSVLAYLRVIGKQMAKMENSYSRGRISSWSRSMAQLARMLDAVQGRKHVVYFSEGFDGRLLLGRVPDAQDETAQRDQLELQLGNHWFVDMDDIYGNTGLQMEVHEMLEEFQRADAVIQTVDISGLTAGRAGEERIRRATQDALFYVANETGGTLFRDANDFTTQLQEVLDRSAVTYLLTIRPQDLVMDGAYHRVRIKADLPKGGRLSHRKGYYAPRPFEELHPIEKGLLASDAIASAVPVNDLVIDVLAAPFRANESQAYVPVIIEVTGDSLLVRHERERMAVEFYTYVNNGQGEMVDFFTQMVSLNIGNARQAFSETGLKYYGHLDLEPGDYLVRVLVRNADTGRTGVETVDVAVPAYDQRDPVLLPPFFLEASQKWFLVREESPAYQRSVVYPFTVNGEPYIPAAVPAMRDGEEAQLCLVAYNMGEGTLEVDARVLTEAGEMVEGGSVDLVERTVTGIDGVDKLLATFRPIGLAAGRYTLEVALRDAAGDVAERNSIPFMVRN